jgi:hypothetical protein
VAEKTDEQIKDYTYEITPENVHGDETNLERQHH